MGADVVTAVIGLVVGLMTGYFFEWRNSRETRRHNAELQWQLRTLRESIYSVGRGISQEEGRALDSATELPHRLFTWLREYQGPDGRIHRSRVLSQFLEAGHTRREITVSLQGLADGGSLRLTGDWIEIL